MATGTRDHIGPYRLLKLIRAGQTTQVWEAIDSTDHHRVAIKVLKSDQCDNTSAIAGMKHEYTVGRDLLNPHVIRIFDLSTDRGVPYLVLELFKHPNLKQGMRQHPEQIRHVLTSIISGAAEGVGYLHRKGWLHRDIKPDNFLASPDGEVKLIDFSIAERSKKGLTRLLSGRSKIQGTLSYMSPEQIRGESLDCRSDIYSFGCTLYEVVAEKVPYTGTSADELLTKHLRAPVPALLSANGAVTAEFSELVGRMMGKDPKERPATMEEFLEEFEKIRVFRVRPKPPADQTPPKGQTP